jgi:Phage tail tube protein
VPTFIHSKVGIFKVQDSAGVTQDISTYLNSVTLAQEMDEVETTTFGAQDTTWLAGYADSTLSVEGNWARAGDAILGPLFNAFKTAAVTTRTWEFGPEGADAGDKKYSGAMVMTKYDIDEAVKDAVTFSCEFHVSGGVTNGNY